MTRVVLLRHATAVPHAPTDWQRPLAQRGVVEAQQAGQWLRHEGIFPDAVIVSSALRTMQTFDALGFPEHPEPRDEAYNASGAQLADLVRLVAPRASTVVVVAHNPGISDLARALGGAVTRNPVKEIGWGTVQVEPSPEAQAWFGPVRSFESFHWHGESFSIPATAVRIAGSPWCPNQAYVQGPHLGMQCHVEITPEMIAPWCRDWEKERAGEPSGRVEGPFMQTPAAMQAGMARRADALHAVADRLYDRWRAGLKG